ncbi:hypothetical protein [Streptomyces sp. NPDC087859]|uniref:hypothetical protein n=1 Tax=Streptomyces sp. NPDC087859 TaxID=3365812 RepID=UPI0038290744
MNAVSAPAISALLVILLGAFVLSVWKTARGLPTRRFKRPAWWAFPAVVLVGIGCVTWFVGALSGGLDVGEACAARGVPYDKEYRAEHWREPSRWFPLHNKCNAQHDLVPTFVNPTLVAVAVLLPCCVAGAVAASALERNKRETPR